MGAFEIPGAGGRMPRAEVARYKCSLELYSDLVFLFVILLVIQMK